MGRVDDMMQMMVITLTGRNEYGWQTALQATAQTFIDAYGDIALERLDGTEVSLERIQESIHSAPFLAPKKMVILRDAGSNQAFVEAADRTLAGMPETTELIIVEPALDKRSSYYKLLKRQTDYREFTELASADLTKWVRQFVDEHGGLISPTDAELLVGRIGSSQRLLASELEKLLLYDSQITHTTIELLSEPTLRDHIFDLLSAAFSGHAQTAVALYQEQRAQRLDPARIIAMLAWQLKVLAIIKASAGRSSSDIARDAKLAPTVIWKTEKIAEGIKLDLIKIWVARLVQIEQLSKQKNLDLDEALQDYIIWLSLNEARR